MSSDNPRNTGDSTVTILKPGVLVDHYEIEGYIGGGGMGEVYLARERRLDKKVALKFLSQKLNEVDSYRKRFADEARSLARINHPNVVHVYELSEYESRPFYSMELVDGGSLSEFLKKSEHSIVDLLSIAVQVTEGLNEVHDAGILHRDIKPGNILLDQKERARLSDFGLAVSPHREHITKSNQILGTFVYMSPEQIAGKELDVRSDIFSLGITLYEMFGKRHPFLKDSEAATMNAISHQKAEPISKLNINTPLSLQLILGKLLEKNPDDRYQNTEDLLKDLKLLQNEIRQSSHGPISKIIERLATVSTRYKTTMISVIILVLALFTWIVIDLIPGLQTPPPPPTQKRLTYFNDAYWGAISPNGKYFAYSLFDEIDGASVWVRDVDAQDPIQIFKADSVYDLNWSPDSRELLFAGFKDTLTGVFLIPALGGQYRIYPHYLPSLPSVTWSPDGNKFAINGSSNVPKSIFVFEKKSGKSDAVVLGNQFELVRTLNWSPKGNKFLLSSYSPNALWTMSVDGSNITQLQSGTTFSPVWSPSGNAVYFLKVEHDNQYLKKLEVNEKTGSPIGEPKILFTGIGCSAAAELTITSDKRKLLFTKENTWNDLLLVSLNETKNINAIPVKLSELATEHSWPTISPDQKWVIYQAILTNGESHLFKVSTDGQFRQRITYNNFINFSPAWSPYGDRIAYGIALKRGDEYKVAVADISGRAAKVYENSLISENLPKVIWAPGEKIIYQKRGNSNLGIIDPTTGNEKTLFNSDTNIFISDPVFSSSGKKIVAIFNPNLQLPQDDPADSSGLWTFDIENSKVRKYLGKHDGHPIGWSTDDRWIYSLAGKSITRINSTSGSVDTIAALNLDFLWKRAAITSDASKLACLNWNFITDIWLIEDFDPEN